MYFVDAENFQQAKKKKCLPYDLISQHSIFIMSIYSDNQRLKNYSNITLRKGKRWELQMSVRAEIPVW